MTSSADKTEPFPSIDDESPDTIATTNAKAKASTSANANANASADDNPDSPVTDDRRSSISNRPKASSSISGRLRRLSATFEQSELPEGFFAATSGITSSMLSGRAATRSIASNSDRDTSGPTTRTNTFPSVLEEEESAPPAMTVHSTPAKPHVGDEPPEAAAFPNGYHFPPKHTFAQSSKLAGITFWNYFTTPVGFFVTIYGLNVVAWGGMLFLLLCNASPAMCTPSCNDIDSPRRKWIEWDSQILNALFCVTGFGLAPWRFRDLWFLMKYRVLHQEVALRRLAGIHRGWFRLRGSTELPSALGPRNIGTELDEAKMSAVPFPPEKIPDAPLTAVRARATKVWVLDLVIWLMVMNTFLQCVLCGFMWGMNRYDRPSWATGLFVGLGCGVAGIAGIIMFVEGKHVKGVEGVPVSQEDLELLARDRERGVYHINNIDDKAEKEKKKKKKQLQQQQEKLSQDDSAV